jgi:trans-aconitate 2-methyltransferase
MERNKVESYKDWNPDLYLKYKDERTQPSIDLISKIDIGYYPQTILDLGCGPGNSSQQLVQRWPDAKLTGVDNSVNMIEKARASYPQYDWVIADAAAYSPRVKFDIVFSNATIQWIPNHQQLFARLLNLTTNRGVLAIQVPRFNEMPLSGVIEKVAGQAKWREVTKTCAGLFTYRDAAYYYDLMSSHYKKIDLWQTDYFHIMPSHASILEWIRSTALKPYLDYLNEGDKLVFENEVLSSIKVAYPPQKDGKVIFPFKRLFMVGYR